MSLLNRTASLEIMSAIAAAAMLPRQFDQFKRPKPIGMSATGSITQQERDRRNEQKRRAAQSKKRNRK